MKLATVLSELATHLELGGVPFAAVGGLLPLLVASCGSHGTWTWRWLYRAIRAESQVVELLRLQTDRGFARRQDLLFKWAGRRWPAAT